uniref:Uncharacterized protein n=1 Tax=Candidatus Kentrum eta TaxID=2126337 RepID=A0A450UEV3_9GAMM|nr:MAG: hypothetical protein BECKH772A_GA0070896_100275 [Candidatus Kentron sp. H]VFJ91933.1 MAG: hypothetical protein BECKH772B_GA0070898_100234 [Candidatus Kentron sp. H]VFJ98778.1 MAG: hypothetical protein BECKH772C_GA0070978_100255 [Candidatus Kentron sp. H]
MCFGRARKTKFATMPFTYPTPKPCFPSVATGSLGSMTYIGKRSLFNGVVAEFVRFFMPGKEYLNPLRNRVMSRVVCARDKPLIRNRQRRIGPLSAAFPSRGMAKAT